MTRSAEETPRSEATRRVTTAGHERHPGMAQPQPPRRSRRLRRRRGAALILVVVVIAALLAIAAPFVVSMRLHEKSARAFHADLRARQLAETARNQAIAQLMRTHPDEERRAREARGDTTSDDEGNDTLDELSPSPAPVTGLRPLDLSAPTGEQAQAEVADARGRIDLNACGPDPIANLLGVTVTTAVVSYEEEDAIPVEDASDFYSDGDPDTHDGFVRINGEYVVYSHVGVLPPARSGEPPRPALMGLVRRAFFSGGPPPDEPDQRREYHAAGSLVQDGRGWKVAFDGLWRHVGTDREGQLARFEGPAAIRRIADWEFGTLRAAMVLQQYGVNLTRLRSWGIGQDTVLAAGLDPQALGEDDAPAGETAEEREKREEAERALKRWGVPLDGLRRFGGARAVVRAYDLLSRLDDEQRSAQIERYRNRAEQLDQRAVKLDQWLKDELKRQLRGLSELRDQSPHLETIGRIELEEKIRPFMTTDAPPLAEAWSEPQVVTHRVEFQAYQPYARVRLQEPRRFMTDMVVRVQARDRSRPPEFRYCAGVRRDEAVLLFPQLEWDYEPNEAEVSAHLPAPVNVNAAPEEVLRAVLTGLMSRIGQRARTGQAPEMVTPADARVIARAIIDEPPANHMALRGLLLGLQSQGEISDHDVDAVVRNAIDPMDAVLLRSSVPFCYASGDVYELTATGVVNDPSGIEVGRRRFREAVRVAPPRDLVWTIDSQWDFTDRLWVGGPAGPGVRPDPRDGGVATLFLPHAWSNLLQTRPIYMGPYGARPWSFPSQSHGQGEGDIQPLLSHEPELARGNTNRPSYPAQGNPSGGPDSGALRQQDWDGEIDGVPLQGVTVAASELGARHYQWEDGTVQDALGPGSFRAWVRVDTLPAPGARAYVFDGARGNGVDRLSLYFDGPTELVLSADDEALDARESAALGVAPRATELRFTLPRPVQVGNWYHVAAFWKGSEPSDLALFVDGRAGGRVTLGSRLQAAIDAWTGTIPLEDASMFPPSGWVRVGGYRWSTLPTRNDRGLSNSSKDADDSCEVLYYTQKQGDLLVVGTPPVSELQNLLAQGATLAGTPQPDPGNVPANARRPQRGSGRRYTFRFNVPGAQRNPVQVQLALGMPHPAGTQVIPYGYRSQVKHEPPGAGSFTEVVRRGGATLVQPLPRTTPATVLYAPVPTYTQAQLVAQGPAFDFYPQVVDATSNVIPVLWAGAAPDAPFAGQAPPRPAPGPGQQVRTNPPGGVEALPNQLGGWPPMGIVRVTSNKTPRSGGTPVQSVERILYRGLDPVGGRLLNCVRGLEGTTASPHFLWDTIVLESIVVTDPTDYPDRPTIADPRVYVSLTQQPQTPAELTEWLSVQKCQDPQLTALGLVMLPARDSLSMNVQVPGVNRTIHPGELPDFPYEYELISQMLQLNGNLGAAPGLLTVQDPLAYDYGQPYKEVLKRWEVSQARAAKSTQRPAATVMHGAGTRVIPTFATRTDDQDESGQGDVVTLLDDTSPLGEEQRVVYGAAAARAPDPRTIPLGVVGDTCDGWLVAFDDFVSRPYDGAANARLARWPIGNLQSIPSLTLGAAHPPSAPGEVVDGAPGALSGRVDDLSTHQQRVQLETILAIDDQATTALMREDPRDLANGRLYRIDDEVVAVVDAAQTQAPPGQGGTWSQVTLRRGMLGTTPQVHGDTLAWRLFWPAHAVAAGPFGGARGAAAPVRALRGEWRQEGYVAVDRGPNSQPRWAEQPFFGVFPYASRKNDHLVRPIDSLDRGVFDHAFGSNAAAPVAGDLLVDLPFRPHDRYADRTWSYEGIFFQSARELTGAYVTHVDWDEVLPGPYCEVKVAVRLDGAPAWDAEPADRPGLSNRLYLFDDPREPNEVLVRADRIELRVYLTFKPGAFYDDAWKRAALVGAVRVHYRQATQSLRREERSD